jgi:flagellar basal-body rod modification protein FlgD
MISASTVSTTNSAVSSDTVTNTTGNTMGQNDFLQLLITQLSNQDPTQPQDDTAFASELAQFSSLQQMTNVNSTLSSFATTQNTLNSENLIGRTATATDSSGSSTVSGTITGVEVDSGTLYLTINGSVVPESNLLTLQ